MASTSSSTLSDENQPSFLPYYTRPLPDVPIYCSPSFLSENLPTSEDTIDFNPLSYDVAGIYGEAEEPVHIQDLDKYIDENLSRCRRESNKQKPTYNTVADMEDHENLIIDEDVKLSGSFESVVDCGMLHTPGVDMIKTPSTNKSSLQNLDNAPRKPFASLPRIYQRPKTLFEKSRSKPMNNKDQKSNWEKVYHVGSEKYVTVSQFRGKKSVHVRQFYMDKNNVSRPTYKGVVLSVQEWTNLTELIGDVNKTIPD